nr:hypothetical protein [Tanacetum cinerariifolium]
MTHTMKTQQIALDDALVVPANSLKIWNCNHRLSSDLKSNKPTIQVVLDALKLTPFYNAFKITANELEIYMQEFWATVSTHRHSLHFKLNGKSHTLNVENLRDMLCIGPRLPGQRFKDPLLEEEFISFIRDLSHTREVKVLTDVNVNYMHQPWRSFDAIINRYRLKSKTKVTKPDMKKKLSKKTKAKGLAILSEMKELVQYQRFLMYLHTNMKVIESWGDIKDEDDNDGNDDDAKSDDHDNDNDDERSKEDVDEGVYTPFDNEFTDAEKLDDEETIDDEEDDEVFKELMKIYVTLTPVSDAQKADKPIQSSYVSSNFTSKFLNLENPSPSDNEIASLMKTSAPHATAILELKSVTLPEFPNFPSIVKFDQRVSTLETKISELKQTNQFAKVVSSIPAIVDKYFASKMKEAVNVDSTMKKIIKNQAKEQVSKIMPNIEKNVTKSLRAEVLVRSTNQPQTAYTIAASLSEFELKKILINKMKANKSIDKLDNQKNLYNALVKQDEDPSTRSDQGTKRRKSGKDDESSKDSRSMENKSLRTSKQASQSQHKNFGKSVCVKEPSHTVEESGMQQDQELITGDNDEQPVDKKGGDSSRRYSTSVTKTKATTYEIKWIEDLVPELWSPVVLNYDQHAYFGTLHWGPRSQRFYEYAKAGERSLIRCQKLPKVAQPHHPRHIQIKSQEKTAYTSHSDPHGIIYVDSFRRKRSMCADVLHKFSDGTLNDVRYVLYDIATGKDGISVNEEMEQLREENGSGYGSRNRQTAI